MTAGAADVLMGANSIVAQYVSGGFGPLPSGQVLHRIRVILLVRWLWNIRARPQVQTKLKSKERPAA